MKNLAKNILKNNVIIVQKIISYDQLSLPEEYQIEE